MPPVYLSHCRGFGTRISTECSNGLWVHSDLSFLWHANWHWNIQHVRLSWLSPTALTRCTDMSINYPEACCGSCFPQAHLARGGTLKYKCDIILMVMGDWTLVPKKTFFTRKHGYLPQSRQQGGSFSLFIPDVLFHHDHNMSTGSSLALVDIQLLFQSINRGWALGTTLLSEMINEIYVQSYWLWAGQAMVTN